MGRKRRENGEGTWRKRKSGAYEYRAIVGQDSYGKNIRKSFYGNRKADCLKKYQNFIATYHNIVLDKTATIEALANRYLCAYQSGVTDYTYSDYERTVRLHINAYSIAHMIAVDVKPIHVRELLNEANNAKSSSMKSKVLWHLSAIFEMAIENDICSKNPCRNIHIKNRLKKATRENTFTLDECVQIRNFCATSDDSRALGVQVLLYTGMRQGELLGLQWNDVDFVHKTITISRTACTSGSGKKQIKHYTKTEAGMRTIPMLPQLENILLNSNKQSLFIVHTYKNDFYNPKTFNQKVYKKFIMSIPNIRVLGTHAFRHAIATHLGNSGASKEDIAQIVGHSDTSVTEKVYWLYDPNKAKKAMTLLPY